jgi:hypothetical protein
MNTQHHHQHVSHVYQRDAPQFEHEHEARAFASGGLRAPEAAIPRKAARKQLRHGIAGSGNALVLSRAQNENVHIS